MLLGRLLTLRAFERRAQQHIDEGCPDLAEAEWAEYRATRCNARTRRGTRCIRLGRHRGGRCRNHGGLSTGPRTPEGQARALANLVPGKGPQTPTGRARALANLRQYQRAFQDYDEAIRLYQQAIQDLDEAILLYPQFAGAYTSRGFTYTELGQYQQAIQDFDEAIRLDPTLAPAFFSRALAYTLLGKDAEAQQDIDRAVELGFDRAVLERDIEELIEELRLDPQDAGAYYDRGLTYTHLGNHRRATEDFNEAIRLDPQDTASFHGRGSANSELGKYRQAIQDFSQASPPVDSESCNFWWRRRSPTLGPVYLP